MYAISNLSVRINIQIEGYGSIILIKLFDVVKRPGMKFNFGLFKIIPPSYEIKEKFIKYEDLPSCFF